MKLFITILNVRILSELNLLCLYLNAIKKYGVI
jgi:hypothetical protein